MSAVTVKEEPQETEYDSCADTAEVKLEIEIGPVELQRVHYKVPPGTECHADPAIGLSVYLYYSSLVTVKEEPQETEYNAALVNMEIEIGPVELQRVHYNVPPGTECHADPATGSSEQSAGGGEQRVSCCTPRSRPPDALEMTEEAATRERERSEKGSAGKTWARTQTGRPELPATALRVLTCDYCDKHYRRRDSLVQHIHGNHLPMNSVVRSHRCSVCNKKYSRKRILALHERIHTGEKPYQCSLCSKWFSLKTTLLIHMRIHTGEKPYECSTCYTRFSHKSTLSSHMRSHTGEKPYECTLCLQQFSQAGQLSAHARIHTGARPYECTECNKRFIRKAQLSAHTRIHTGEKPFECRVCSKQFNSKSHLSRHSKVHTVERRYECPVCNKQFSNRGNFWTHSKVHTS